MSGSDYWAVIDHREVLGHGPTPEQAIAQARLNRYAPTQPLQAEPYLCSLQLALILESTPDALLPPADVCADTACLARERQDIEMGQMALF